ncbi:MAG: DMT family transporter [Halobacteriaceae archaeon]
MDPMLALGVAVIAVSTSAILIRAGDAPKPVMAFYRVLFTTLLLAPLAGRYLEDFRRLDNRDVLAAGAAGIALAAHFAAWFESVDRTSIAASVTLVQTAPVFVAIGARTLLDERLTRSMIAGILLAAGGSAVMSAGGIFGGTGPAPLLGNALAVVGAIMAAGYVLAGRSIRQRVRLVPYVLVVYAVCTVVLFGYVLATGFAFGGYPRHEWLLFLGMAVGPGLFGHTVVNWALEHLESSVVSVTLVGEPVGSTILALAIFGEVPTVATVLGGAIVLSGIVVTAQGRRT